MSEQSLTDLNVSNFKDYIRQLPGVTSGGRGPGRNEIFIRGVSAGKGGLKIAGISTEPNVALYIDEAPISIGGRNIDPYVTDINRVEVLKGPQGTLFGASSQAGTVRIITNKPEFNEFSAGFDASVGSTSGGEASYGQEAHINIPLVDDKLAVRFALWNVKQGGYIDNIAGIAQIPLSNPSLDAEDPPATRATASNEELVEDDFNDAYFQGIRTGLKYAINDDWDVLVQHTHQDIETEGVFDFDPELGDLNVQTFRPDRATDSFDLTSWTLNGRISNLELVYTGSFLDRTVDAVSDYTGYANTGPFIPYYICDYPGYANCGAPDFFLDQFFEVQRDIHEFRVSTDSERRFSGIFGLFFDDTTTIERGDWHYTSSVLQGFPQNSPFTGAVTTNPNPRPPGVRFFNDFTRGKKEFSFFGEGSWKINDEWTFTGGFRRYDIDISLAGSTNSSVRGPIDGDTGRIANAPAESQSDTILKANLKWQTNDDVLLYATWSEGYRPGGFNRNGGAGASDTSPGVPFTYISDELTNIEFGWKTDWLDGALRFNGSIYNIDWQGIQIIAIDFAISNLTFLSNAGDAEIFGAEIGTTWQATDNLTLFFDLSYNDTELTKVPPNIVSLSAEGSPLALSPELQYVLRGRYEWELNDGAGAFAQLGMTKTDDSVSAIVVSQQLPLEGYTTVDASIGYTKDDWSVSIFVENLADTRGDLFISNEDDIARTTPNRPRTFTLRFSYDI